MALVSLGNQATSPLTKLAAQRTWVIDYYVTLYKQTFVTDGLFTIWKISPEKLYKKKIFQVGNSRPRAKKKRKSRKKNLAKVALTNSSGISKLPVAKDEVKCYACHETGATIACQDPSCPQLYHLACLGLTKDPSSKSFALVNFRE